MLKAEIGYEVTGSSPLRSALGIGLFKTTFYPAGCQFGFNICWEARLCIGFCMFDAVFCMFAIAEFLLACIEGVA